MAVLEAKYYKIKPKDCLKLDFGQSFEMLENLLSKEVLETAMNVENPFPSPVSCENNTNWCKTLKIISINPRLAKTFWGIVKYALTFPEKGVHIMPLWETGDRGSLYVQNSWNLNDEFFDKDLEKLGFSTSEEQLKLVINVLHALGKVVCFDALPHVDNFSQISLLNPSFFEWAELNPDKTTQLFPPEVDFNTISKKVEKVIIKAANAPENFFELEEKAREDFLFPKNSDRTQKRIRLMEEIRKSGFEPLPVTEHAPCRPVVFKKMESDGEKSWAVFDVKNRTGSAKVFGCITPYKWYKIDENGFPLANCKEREVWRYFIEKINRFQQEYNFDFLRADMAHNQISHSHANPVKNTDESEEMWAVLKSEIQKTKPYFAVLAEAFYNTYYIDGIKDMINKKADIVLGNMNFMFLNEDFVNLLDDFVNPFRENFPFSPCLCTFSTDGDLPEHAKYFQSEEANELRFFISMFFNLPSYTGMGYETKALKPTKYEEFSHEFVKYQQNPFLWGENEELFEAVSDIRDLYLKYSPVIDSYCLKLLERPTDRVLIWGYEAKNEPEILCIANMDNEITNFPIKFAAAKNRTARLVYTNSRYEEIHEILEFSDGKAFVQNIYIGECAVYEFV